MTFFLSCLCLAMLDKENEETPRELRSKRQKSADKAARSRRDAEQTRIAEAYAKAHPRKPTNPLTMDNNIPMRQLRKDWMTWEEYLATRP